MINLDPACNSFINCLETLSKEKPNKKYLAFQEAKGIYVPVAKKTNLKLVDIMGIAAHCIQHLTEKIYSKNDPKSKRFAVSQLGRLALGLSDLDRNRGFSSVISGIFSLNNSRFYKLYNVAWKIFNRFCPKADNSLKKLLYNDVADKFYKSLKDGDELNNKKKK